MRLVWRITRQTVRDAIILLSEAMAYDSSRVTQPLSDSHCLPRESPISRAEFSATSRDAKSLSTWLHLPLESADTMPF